MFQKLPPVITGTLYLSAAGIVTRFLGFFYKIWLGNLIGAEELGIYQLVFPVFSICMAICGGPFQTAVSKFTAEYQDHNPVKAAYCLQTALIMSGVLSALCALFILLFHKPIAVFFLLNDRCGSLLPYIAFSIPLSAVHNCITGWYYGQKKTSVPAWSNLAEQGIRILFVYFLLKSGLEIDVKQVVQALVTGELASAIFTVLSCRLDWNQSNRSKSDHRKIYQSRTDGGRPAHTFPNPDRSANLRIRSFFEITTMVWPLTANRLTMNLLQSVEAIMIPSRLILYGIPESTALSMYGTLTGMSMSFIMFPTAFTGSFSLMLLPDISKAYAEHRDSYLRKASRLSLSVTFLIGCFFTAVFFLLGETIGNLCFPGTLAGTYIRSLSWLCPFLYLNHVLTSILHGMGMTAQTFRTQLAGLILRLCVTVFLIPFFGMKCYFTALLGSQLLMCGLNVHTLYANNRSSQ